MATFSYTAKDKKGAKVEGTMDADARTAVVSRLQQMGYFPIAINQVVKKGGKVVAAAPANSAPARNSTTAAPKAGASKSEPAAPAKQFSFRRGVKTADLANFNRQLADLIGAGIQLVKGLAILAKQTETEELRVIIHGILDDVQGGTTFADSLGKYPAVFSKLYVAMVKSGEAGGMLDEVLQRLADYSEQEEVLRGKIKSALAYPAVMIVAGSGAVAVMIGFVIPKITDTFKRLDQALPAITQLLITLSDGFRDYWLFILAGGAALGFVFYQFISSAEGRMAWDRLSLKLPVMGPLTQKRQVARFTRTLGSLLRNGVSILSALDIVREVVDNGMVRIEVDRVIGEITQGSSIAQPLRESQIFPAVAVNMIAIGEETGRLPEVLLRISESYEVQAERQVRTLTSLIEPLIIVVMGMIVGFIVIAMLLPIFSLDPSGGGRK